MKKVFVVSYILDDGAKKQKNISCICSNNKEEAKTFLKDNISKENREAYFTIISIREIEYGEVI